MLLNNPIPLSKYLKEGVVFDVDYKRYTCKCRTSTGEVMDNVTWMLSSGGSSRAGSTKSPKVGNIAFISTHCGYPLILGYKPIPYDDEMTLSNTLIDDYSAESVDTGNFGNYVSNTLKINASMPRDAVGGDEILATEGGSMVGILRGGSVLLKSSSLAQIFISKIDDLSRIVARNQECFSDVHSDLCTSIGGRQYRFTGYSDTIKNVREDRYKYLEVRGDTVAGEKLKGNYKNVGIQSVGAADGVIMKNMVLRYPSSSDDGYKDSYDVVYHETLNLDGEYEKKIIGTSDTDSYLNNTTYSSIVYQLSSGANYSSGNTTPTNKEYKVGNSSSQGLVSITADEVITNWNDKASISHSASGIVIDWDNKGVITIDNSGIKASWNNGAAELILDNSSSTLTNSGHSISVTAGGISMS